MAIKTINSYYAECGACGCTLFESHPLEPKEALLRALEHSGWLVYDNGGCVCPECIEKGDS